MFTGLLLSHPGVSRDLDCALRRLCRSNGAVLTLGLLLLFALWGSLPLVSRAQPETVEQLVERGVRAGVESELLRDVVQQAEERGLESRRIAAFLEPAIETARKDYPARPILMSTLEGLGKTVPADQLDAHLETLRHNIERAGQTVSQWSKQRPSAENEDPQRAQLIESVAQAHRRGLSMEEIHRLRAALQETGREPSSSLLAVAIEVAPDLTESSASEGNRRELLAAAVEAGYGEGDLRALSEILTSTRGQHRPASAQVRGALHSIERGASVAALKRQIVSNVGPALSPNAHGVPSVTPAGLDISSRIPVQRPPRNDQPPRNQGPSSNSP